MNQETVLRHPIILFTFIFLLGFSLDLKAQTYPCDEYRDPDETGSYALPDGMTWCDVIEEGRREGRAVSAYGECKCSEQKKQLAKREAEKEQREAERKASAEKSARMDEYYERRGELSQEMSTRYKNKDFDGAISIAEQIISLTNSNSDMSPETQQSQLSHYQNEIEFFERERDKKEYQIVLSHGSSTTSSGSSQAPGGTKNGSNQSGATIGRGNTGSTKPSFNSLEEFNAYKEQILNSKKNKNSSPTKNVSQEPVPRNHTTNVQKQPQQRISENTAQQQVEEFHRKQLQAQQLEMQRQKEAYERKQQEWYENFQAQLEQNRIDQQNLNAAGDVAAQQVAAGNYQQAGITYGTELANQGETEAAIASMAIGTGIQIWSEISKEKKKKKEAEARRLEQQRIQREREQKRAELLRRQKRQFESMVAAQRQAKKNIITSRTGFFAKEESYTKTFDKFSQSGEPIYIFFVEAANDYKEYKERVSFPDQVDIRIKEKAGLDFSPIIRIYPNSSGEYPFLKTILDKIKNEFVQKSGTTYKVYNWTLTLEEAQESYKSASEKAIAAHFTPAFPEQLLVDFNDSSTESNHYWTDARRNGAGDGSVSKAERAPDYWNLSKIPDSLKLSKPETKKADYWKVREKKEDPKVRNPEVKEEKKVNYWNKKD